MILDVKDEVRIINKLAVNIAWMYSFKLVDMEETKAALKNIALNSHVEDEFAGKVYERYVAIIKSRII